MKAKKVYDANWWRRVMRRLDKDIIWQKVNLNGIIFGITYGFQIRPNSMYAALNLYFQPAMIIAHYTGSPHIRTTRLTRLAGFRRIGGFCVKNFRHSLYKGLMPDELKWGKKYRVVYGDPIEFEAVFVAHYPLKKGYDSYIFEMEDGTIVAVRDDWCGVYKAK